MSEEPLDRDTDFDRDLWRGHARRALREAFDALEGGRVYFGDWERLFLSAAIDHFRDRHFEQASMSARRIFHEQQRPPFTGQFTQQKSLADLRAHYEELAGDKPS
jgi:hypothetical protein